MMQTNLSKVLELLSRQDTNVDFLAGTINQSRALAATLSRGEQELEHRYRTSMHLIDNRPTAAVELEVRKCKAQIRMNLVQFVQTVQQISEQLEDFDPLTALEVDVKAEVA